MYYAKLLHLKAVQHWRRIGSSTLFSRHFQRSVFEYMLCCALQYFVVLPAARFKLESQLATALAIFLLNLLAVAMVSRAC